jgi:flagellar M-ring protein FliF
MLIIQSRSADYSLLFANLTSADASAVIDKLKEQKLAYQIKDGGTSIFVPADKVYELRLELAGNGLPRGAGVGFEIFDKQSFGLTDFAQKVNYRRALQGELARTISSLDPVVAARVHLAMPEKRLFKDQQEQATSSIILKLVPGRTLTEAQIQGIVHLVAGSVEELNPEGVSVIDENGRMLSRNREGDLTSPINPQRLDYQSAMEKKLEQRAQSLLDRAVGPGNSLVRVTAALDFSQRESLEEAYDPSASVIRSEQTVEEKSGTPVPGGVPGAQGNLNGNQSAFTVQPSSRSDETVNYEISKVVTKKVESVGSVQSLSVAVLVGDRQEAATAPDQAPAYVPRKADELKDIEAMITSALGLDAARGDRIVVVSRPFEGGGVREPLDQPIAINDPYQYLPLIKYGLLALAALLLYLMLLRPLMKTLRGEARRVEHYKTVEQLEAELAGDPLRLGAPADPVGRLRKEILESQATSAQVIRTWLKES